MEGPGGSPIQGNAAATETELSAGAVQRVLLRLQPGGPEPGLGLHEHSGTVQSGRKQLADCEQPGELGQAASELHLRSPKGRTRAQADGPERLKHAHEPGQEQSVHRPVHAQHPDPRQLQTGVRLQLQLGVAVQGAQTQHWLYFAAAHPALHAPPLRQLPALLSRRHPDHARPAQTERNGSPGSPQLFGKRRRHSQHCAAQIPARKDRFGHRTPAAGLARRPGAQTVHGQVQGSAASPQEKDALQLELQSAVAASLAATVNAPKTVLLAKTGQAVN